MAYVGTPIDTQNQFQSLQGKRFNGDGSTTAFTLDVAPSSVFDIEVFVENVRQDPNSAYGISGTTLTFTGAPPSGTNNIYVVHQAKAVGTIDVPASGVVPASLASNIISGQTELAVAPADTDEFLISDAGTIKRIDYSLIKASNTPAFLAYGNTGQAASTDTDTVVSLNLEVFDTDGKYDTSTYKFTPTVAGKYFLFGQVRLNTDVNFNEFQVNIIKNGSTGLARGGGVYGHYDIYCTSVIADLDADDYVQLKTYQASGSNKDITDSQILTFFGGYKLIGA
jgi:hypothetical protein